MTCSSLLTASSPLIAFALFVGHTNAQATTPTWSTFFPGGNARDEIVVMRRGPGNLITVVGDTTSTNLPVTAGALQPAPGGGSDVFVARFDANQSPPALLWCTYLGGADHEFGFDAEVDPVTGVTTVVGVSLSTNFPAPGSLPSPTRNGPSDGFVAQIDANGTALLASLFFGGSNHDRIGDVELAAGNLFVTVAGVSESANLPGRTNSHAGGSTDGFVAQVPLPTNPGGTPWSTYLGGSSTEGMPFGSWQAQPGLWQGNLDRLTMTLDTTGRPVVATASFSTNAPTAGIPIQATSAGGADVYVAVVNPPGTGPSLAYATYLGGSLDERPRAIARHPGGGFVLGGTTFSGNFPVTTNCLQPTFRAGTQGSVTDGFLFHLDPTLPGAAARRYATYLGGNAGEDAVLTVAVESSGRVTVGGFTFGGVFDTTPRCLQDTHGTAQFLGFVARLQLMGQGSRDLLYSTLVGGIASNTDTWCNSAVVDDVGNVLVAGTTTSTMYPQQNPLPLPITGYEGAITHLPLLPGGVFRDGLAFANPACSQALYTGAGSAPVPSASFTITATNAPPNTIGILALGSALPTPTTLPPPLNGTLLVNPFVLATVSPTSALGSAEYTLALDPTLPALPSWGLAAQWFFLTNASCPGTGILANSERLNF